MRIIKNLNILFIVIVFFLMLVGNAYAQEQGFRWGKWSRGQDIYGGGGMPDKIVDSYIDSVGNTYIFGRFGKGSRLGENGPYICPMDSISGYMNLQTIGVFLAKIDTAGNILWCKSVRGATHNEVAIPWNMVVKDNNITIAVDAQGWNWLYLFDTLLTTFCDHYTGERTTYFATFDFDGNIVDIHDIRLYALSSPTARTLRHVWLSGHDSRGRFAIDDDRNIHIFSSSEFAMEDSIHKAYILVDNDTNKKYLLNVNTMNGMYFSESVYYRMNSNWELIGSPRYLIDSIAGWQPPWLGSLATIMLCHVVTDGNDVYVNGYFKCYDGYNIAGTMTDSDTFTATIYLDSVHYLKAENIEDFEETPFLLKFDSDGNVSWMRQLYTEPFYNDNPGNYMIYNFGLTVDESNAFFVCSPCEAVDSWHPNGTLFFLDSAHTIPVATHINNNVLIVSYDKTSGNLTDYYMWDTIHNHYATTLLSQGDELILNAVFEIRGENSSFRRSELCRINKYTKEVAKSDLITCATRMRALSMSIDSNGWVFRSFTGERARVFDSIPVSPTQETSIMSFFYDPSLDMRIKPCPQVDSLWGSMTVQHTATLSWHSQFSHIGYEVAYIPEGGSWDDAVSLETSDTSATITLPDDHCYQFRLRGLCDGRREATSPWSDPVTLCPEVGIADVEHLTAAITPNPTTGMVRITSSEPMRQVVIYDLSGKEVYGSTVDGQRPTASEIELDISTLPEGSYIVKITTTTGHTLHRKLIKK